MAPSASRDRAQVVGARYAGELPGAVIVIASDGTVLGWNDEASQLYGYDAGEVVGRSILMFLVPDEEASVERAWLQGAARVGRATRETRRIRKNGWRIWVEVTTRLHDEPGHDPIIVLNDRDITHVRCQRLSDTLRTRFRGALEAAPDAIALVDRDGYMVYVNGMVERTFGFSPRELVGETVERLVPGRFHVSHDRHRARYFENPQTRPMGTGLHLRGRRRDGSEFPVEISLSPLDLDGTPLAMAAIRDVSARAAVEEALRNANDELESFTYSVSHDLRAPIRQIDGFAQLLAEHLGPDADAEAVRLLDRIAAGASYMGRLVDDLLGLAHVSRQDLRPRQADLEAIVADVIAQAQPDLAGRQVEWRVGALPPALCDPGLIRVVFTNLIANALKYTRSRSPATIEIGTRAAPDGVRYFVRDNGVGFDMAYADKLFGVFQRLHDASEFEGTGVGLATVRRIIRRHGGDIHAEARPDEGATFSFTIGAPASAAPPGAASAPAAASGKASP